MRHLGRAKCHLRCRRVTFSDRGRASSEAMPTCKVLYSRHPAKIARSRGVGQSDFGGKRPRLGAPVLHRRVSECLHRAGSNVADRAIVLSAGRVPQCDAPATFAGYGFVDRKVVASTYEQHLRTTQFKSGFFDKPQPVLHHETIAYSRTGRERQ